MADRGRELILNPQTGRYCKKYGSIWKRLVSEGVLAPEATIPDTASKAPPKTLEKKIDQSLLGQATGIAAENKSALKGMSRAEADEVISKFLYERLIQANMREPKTGTKPVPPRIGNPQRSIVVPIRKHTAPISIGPPRKLKPMFLGKKSGDETDYSIGESQIDETDYTTADRSAGDESDS